mmetsp:Transcript_50124/g.73193  ORF Transcript_50124/g.73193 Transcript_50124/m.73193 type:complete len:172 (-) Transcript_50124:539-1054(-)
MDSDFSQEVSANDILMEEMALYAEKHDLQGMLKEYMKRLVLENPEDPLVFLREQIARNPYAAPEQKLPDDLRDPTEKRKYMDCRPQPEQESLLLEIFNLFRKDANETVLKARALVVLRRDRHIILERFPKHFSELIRTIEMVPADENGHMVFDTFGEYCLQCLAGPGGRAL